MALVNRWLLIETFGGEGHQEPSVIGVGRTVKRMIPLASVLGRGHYLDDVRAIVARVVQTGQPVRDMTHDGKRQMIGDPLISYAGRIHGVYAWTGGPEEEPPARDPAGAWYLNLTTDQIGGSDDLLDLYGVKPEDRRTKRHLAELFGRLITNADESAGLALVVRSRPGEEHQATWSVRRDDGELRAANFACRAVAEQGENGQTHVVVRGITHDIGPADQTPSAPPRMVLAQQVLTAERQPGTHRAIINLHNLRLIRWVDGPLPGVAWEYDPQHEPAIHPEDLPAAKEMSARLVTGRVEGTLRLRSVTGGWMHVTFSANLILLDQHTTAALVAVSAPPTASP